MRLGAVALVWQGDEDRGLRQGKQRGSELMGGDGDGSAQDDGHRLEGVA